MSEHDAFVDVEALKGQLSERVRKAPLKQVKEKLSLRIVSAKCEACGWVSSPEVVGHGDWPHEAATAAEKHFKKRHLLFLAGNLTFTANLSEPAELSLMPRQPKDPYAYDNDEERYGLL